MPASDTLLPPLSMIRVLLIALCCAPLAHAEDDVDFVRDIRPIISENCAFCHGPDEASREADLRLDLESGAAAVIENGNSAESELYRRLISDDEFELMPPPDSNRSLTPKQIELVRRWIDQGAPWEQHWSFRPIVAPDVPTPEPIAAAPIRNPIDAFVRHQLAQSSLAPAPEAPRQTLIRRLALDLTGLPPTPEQIDRFLSDTSDDAYEQLVDRLLDSPAYGQRMAWDWLDAARYADTNGYQGDRERTMWPWRDWVVKAFNENLPYDQFTVWQLAGDLLPEATHEQELATGFCRNHMINGEGGRIAEENRIEYVFDMLETMGTVWMGMTLNCCRCHDHKYDPISNTEYYRLFAYFNQTPVNGGGGDPQMAPNLAVPTPEQKSKLELIGTEIAALDSQLKEAGKSLAAKQSAWEQQELAKLAALPQWRSLQVAEATATHAKLTAQDDNSFLASGPGPDNDTYTVTGSVDLSQLTGIRVEALRDKSLKENSLSLASSGNFVLTELEVSLVGTEPESSSAIEIGSAEASFEQGIHKVTNAFDGKKETGWAVLKGRIVDREHAAVFRFKEPVTLDPGTKLKIVLRHDSIHKQHNIGRFRLSLTDVAEPKLGSASERLLDAIQTAADERTKDQSELIQKSHRESDAEYKSLQDQRNKLAKQRDDLQRSLPKVMVMADMEKPRKTFILSRGLYNKPTTEVQAKLPAFLPAPSASDDSNRLELARWLVNPANPLTARVTVNRFWQQIFGIGLVKTTEDFGRQGEIPIQMDLLNWLAAEFQADGWNVKNLIRLIVTSHTYRQSSKVTDPDVYGQDPDNRLLARSSRYRMPAWMLRDQALAASGLLSEVNGGPSVNTYQPAGVWEEASFGKKTYRQDSGEKLYRRSLYIFWRRIIAPTMMFDSASRQTCTVKTGRTNTPLHALQTLNNVTYVEAARALAEAALSSESKRDAERLDLVMKRTIARPASEAERTILLAGLERTRRQFDQDRDQALALLSVGESPRDESIDAVEHAAWATLCLAVLNLDETLNRE